MPCGTAHRRLACGTAGIRVCRDRVVNCAARFVPKCTAAGQTSDNAPRHTPHSEEEARPRAGSSVAGESRYLPAARRRIGSATQAPGLIARRLGLSMRQMVVFDRLRYGQGVLLLPLAPFILAGCEVVSGAVGADLRYWGSSRHLMFSRPPSQTPCGQIDGEHHFVRVGVCGRFSCALSSS